HEPIEQLSSLRSMPNLNVIRPAVGKETRAAWKVAMESTETTTVLVLSRQNLSVIEGTKEHADEMVAKGAYVVSPAKNETPEGILIATG
ncbi:transketolase, partial [Escherichia coli]|nr:transketolase [Escherichia coli]